MGVASLDHSILPLDQSQDWPRGGLQKNVGSCVQRWPTRRRLKSRGGCELPFLRGRSLVDTRHGDDPSAHLGSRQDPTHGTMPYGNQSTMVTTGANQSLDRSNEWDVHPD